MDIITELRVFVPDGLDEYIVEDQKYKNKSEFMNYFNNCLVKTETIVLELGISDHKANVWSSWYDAPRCEICSKMTKEWILFGRDHHWNDHFVNFATEGFYCWNINEGNLESTFCLTGEQVRFVLQLHRIKEKLQGKHKDEFQTILERIADMLIKENYKVYS